MGLYSQRMLVTERYKLVFNVDELYDLCADPHELRDLIDAPEYEPVRRDVYGRMFRRVCETRDAFERDLWWPKFEAERQGVSFAQDLTYGHKAP